MSDMRHKVPVLVILVFLFLCVAVSPAFAFYEKFYSENGGFKVAFEGEPREFTQDQNSEFGKIIWVAYAYQSVEYLGIIIYCDLPKNMIQGISPEVLLQQIGEGMVDSGDSIMSTKKIYVSGINGIELISAKGNTYTRRQFLLVGQRMYICGVETTEDLVDSPKVTDFLDSFELVSAF